MRQRPAPVTTPAPKTGVPPTVAPSATNRRADKPRKLSFKEQKELEALPERIDALEQEKDALYARLSDPAFLRDGPAVSATTARLDAIEQETAAAMARWEALEAVASGG